MLMVETACTVQMNNHFNLSVLPIIEVLIILGSDSS